MAKIYDPITKEWVSVINANGVAIKDISESFHGAKDVEEALQYVAGDLANKDNNIKEILNTLSEQTEKIDWLMINGGGGGGTGSGGSSAPTLTSRIVEDTFIVDKGTDVILPLYFTSPNLGDGVLIVTVDDKDWDSYPIKQGSNNVNLGVLPKLSNKVTVYAKDRVGLMSNPIEWTVVCGGIDLTLDFDYNVDYNVGSNIYMPFNIYSPTKDPVTLVMNINGEEKRIPCVQGYNEYVFEDLNVGIHRITLQATDGTFSSAKITFNLVVLNSDSLYLSTTFQDGSCVEYGVPVIIDYRISNPTDEFLTVNQYLDGDLYKTLQSKRGSYSWTLNDLTVKDGYRYRIEVVTSTGERREISGSFDVIQGDFNPVQVNTQGLVYRLDASTRTNQDLDKENPVYEGIQAKLHGFNFASNGWIDGVLKCNVSTYVEIDYSPWGDNAPNGSTIEVVFKTENIGEDMARIFNYTDTFTNKGAFIGFDEAKMGSISNTAKVFLNADEWTTVSFVLDRKNKFAKIFLNGICTRAFALTDSGTGVETSLEDFVVNNKMYLNCDNNLANGGSTEIKDFRIYRRALTDDEIVNNLISQEKDLVKQKLLYDFNYENKTLPTIRMYGDTTNMTLENAVPMRVKYISPNTEKYGQPFDLPYCEVYWQGTSSLDYVLKNYNIRLKDENNADAYYTPYPNGVKENLFCLKADYMESSHSRNVGIAKFVENCMYDTKNPAQIKDSKVRNCIEGFPILLYINDELQGVYNFNTDRYSVATYGYTDPDKHLVYEISANSDTTAGAFFKWQPFVQGKLKYYKSSISSNNSFNNDNGMASQYIKVEPGSTITFTPGNDITSTSSIELLTYRDKDNKRVGVIGKGANNVKLANDINYIRLNVFTSISNVPPTVNINGKDYILELTTNAIDIETEYVNLVGSNKSEIDYYKSDFRSIYPPTRVAGNDNFAEIKRLVEWVNDASEEDFRDNLDQYFNREYLLRYYIFAMMFGAVDSLGKNMKLATWDGRIWYPQVYDADTTIGLDNTGFLKFDMDIEVGDEGVYNTTSSQLWSKVKLLLWNEIKAEYSRMRNDRFTLENIFKYIVDEQMGKIPASFYNRDMQTKYLNFGSSYLYALHGKGEQQIKYWLQGRLIYLDSLLGYNVSMSDYVTVRSSKLGEVYLDIQTFTPMYLTVRWRNTQDGSADQVLKVKKGQTTRFSFNMPTATDQEIRIFGGKHLKSLGDLSNLQPTTVLLAKAPNIKELVCHSPNLVNTDLSECINLRRVDLKDCTSLGGGEAAQPVINVTKCKNIDYVNCQNTQITAVVTNAKGSNIREIWYPDTIQEISLVNCHNLVTIGLNKGHSCKKLKLVNCPKIEHFGNREWQTTTQTYKYSNAYFLNGVSSLTLDNSYNVEVLDFEYGCEGLSELVLNNPKTHTIKLGVNTMESSDLYLNGNPNFKDTYLTEANDLVIRDNGVVKNLIITNGKHTGRKLFKVNNFDISGLIGLESFVSSLSTLCTNLNLPLSLKDLRIDLAIDNGDKDPYWCYNIDFCNGWSGGSMWGTGNVGRGNKCKADSNLILSMTTPLSKPNYTEEEDLRYVYDLEGLELEKFCLFGFNSPTKYDNNHHYEGTKFLSDFKVDFKNINAKFTDTLMPFQDYWVNSVQGKLDYSEFEGTGFSFALNNLNDENVEVVLPSSWDNIQYFNKTLTGATLTNTLRWTDTLTSKFLNHISNTTDLENINLIPQNSYEEDGVTICSDRVSRYQETILGLGSNLRFIKELNLPNVTSLGRFLYQNTSPIEEIGKIIAPKVELFNDACWDNTTLKRIDYIEVGQVKPCSFPNAFLNCTNLVSPIEIKARISNLGSTFKGSKITEINLDNSTITTSGAHSRAFEGVKNIPRLKLVSEGEITNYSIACDNMFLNASIRELDLTEFHFTGNHADCFNNFVTESPVVIQGKPNAVNSFFKNCASDMSTWDIRELDIYACTNLNSMFLGCTLTSQMAQEFMDKVSESSIVNNCDHLFYNTKFTDDTEEITFTVKGGKYPKGVERIIENANVTNLIYDYSLWELFKYNNTHYLGGCPKLKSVTFKMPKYVSLNDPNVTTIDKTNEIGLTFIWNLPSSIETIHFDNSNLVDGWFSFGQILPKGKQVVQMKNLPVQFMPRIQLGWYEDKCFAEGTTFHGNVEIGLPSQALISSYYTLFTKEVARDLYLNHVGRPINPAHNTIRFRQTYKIINNLEDGRVTLTDQNFTTEEYQEVVQHLTTLGWNVLK